MKTLKKILTLSAIALSLFRATPALADSAGITFSPASGEKTEVRDGTPFRVQVTVECDNGNGKINACNKYEVSAVRFCLQLADNTKDCAPTKKLCPDSEGRYFVDVAKPGAWKLRVAAFKATPQHPLMFIEQGLYTINGAVTRDDCDGSDCTTKKVGKRRRGHASRSRVYTPPAYVAPTPTVTEPSYVAPRYYVAEQPPVAPTPPAPVAAPVAPQVNLTDAGLVAVTATAGKGNNTATATAIVTTRATRRPNWCLDSHGGRFVCIGLPIIAAGLLTGGLVGGLCGTGHCGSETTVVIRR